MRSTQFIGLNDRAKEFIAKHIVYTEELCPHCGEVIATKQSISYNYGRSVLGLASEQIPLRDFVLNIVPVVIAKEVHQVTKTSSNGLVVFTCLEINCEKRFKWTKCEMERYL